MSEKQLVAALEKCLVANELDGNLKFVYRFTDPDGVRTGKSGYSFGRCQFDIFNNSRAIACLMECRFAADDITRLKAQTTNIDDLNAKLLAAATTVDAWDSREFASIVGYVRQICDARHITFADDETFIHACDYHNQFGMDPNGKAINYLAKLGHPVTPGDILAYKKTTVWGQKRPDDVNRRFANIHKIMRG